MNYKKVHTILVSHDKEKLTTALKSMKYNDILDVQEQCTAMNTE